jgi:hypothetical protein
VCEPEPVNDQAVTEQPGVAADLLAVRVRRLKGRPLGLEIVRVVAAVLRDVFLGMFALGAGGSDKPTCCVEIILRDTSGVVHAIEHESPGDAAAHVESLEHRLRTMTFWDFCREVGIPYTKAVAIRGGLPDTEPTEGPVAHEPGPRHARG